MVQNRLSINSSWVGILRKNLFFFFQGILAHKSRTRNGNDPKPLPFYAEFICGHESGARLRDGHLVRILLGEV